MDQTNPSSPPFADTEGQDNAASKKISEFSQRLNPVIRNHIIASIGELAGTFFFLFLALSATLVVNSTVEPDNVSRLLYISISFGWSLLVNVWVWFRVGGGLFNPAITLGLVLSGAVMPIRGLVITIAQIAGAIIASLVVHALFPYPLANVVTNLGPLTTPFQGFMIEAFLTFQLTITILMLAAEKHAATFMSPLVIGFALFVAELSGVSFTGGSLNPARSLGPALVAGEWENHWVYWAGPVVGAIGAAGMYKILKILNYETANPGQDATSADEGVHLD